MRTPASEEGWHLCEPSPSSSGGGMPPCGTRGTRGGAGAVHQECAEENSQRSGLQKLRIEPLLRRYSVLTLPTWAVAVGLHFWTVFHDNIPSGKLPSGRRRGRTNPEACACRACRRVEPSMQPSPTRTVDDRYWRAAFRSRCITPPCTTRPVSQDPAWKLPPRCVYPEQRDWVQK